MPMRAALLIGACLLSLGLWASAATAQSFGPLTGAAFGQGSKALLGLLHGDVSRGGGAVYHCPLAKEIAVRNAGVTAVALVRPGYGGAQGISPETDIHLIFGSWDSNTPFFLSKHDAEDACEVGLTTTTEQVSGAGHGLNKMSDAVHAAVEARSPK